ncbi:MAG: hypothetical protein J7503_13205, partial [Cellulomonas iranensis]|nr:hypothetical protein [Cellulomonas iranensis]
VVVDDATAVAAGLAALRTEVELPVTYPQAALAEADAAARASRAAETYAAVDAVADASHAFWLAGRLHHAMGGVDDAIWNLESAVEGFGIARATEPRGAAASMLVDMLRAAGRDDRADEVVASLTR